MGNKGLRKDQVKRAGGARQVAQGERRGNALQQNKVPRSSGPCKAPWGEGVQKALQRNVHHRIHSCGGAQLRVRQNSGLWTALWSSKPSMASANNKPCRASMNKIRWTLEKK